MFDTEWFTRAERLHREVFVYEPEANRQQKGALKEVDRFLYGELLDHLEAGVFLPGTSREVIELAARTENCHFLSIENNSHRPDAYIATKLVAFNGKLRELGGSNTFSVAGLDAHHALALETRPYNFGHLDFCGALNGGATQTASVIDRLRYEGRSFFSFTHYAPYHRRCLHHSQYLAQMHQFLKQLSSEDKQLLSRCPLMYIPTSQWTGNREHKGQRGISALLLSVFAALSHDFGRQVLPVYEVHYEGYSSRSPMVKTAIAVDTNQPFSMPLLVKALNEIRLYGIQKQYRGVLLDSLKDTM